jgi:hypothetical protein
LALAGVLSSYKRQQSWGQWLIFITSATQEAEVRRIKV